LRFWTASRLVRKKLGGYLNAAGPWGFTLVGFACLTLSKSGGLAKLEPVRDLQLAVGALVGTILTLGFSLSIIALQRAVSVPSAAMGEAACPKDESDRDRH